MAGFLLLLITLSFPAQALTVSGTGVEVAYQYEFTYRSLNRSAQIDQRKVVELANFHASHLYGLFHSPEVSEQTGYPAELVEGFAGTKVPQVTVAEAFRVNGDPYQWVRYRAQGVMVVFRPVLERWLKGMNRAQVKLPLLKDFPAIYSDNLKAYSTNKLKECTDDHYWQPVEFSYFYNPFRCPQLGREPIAATADFFLSRTSTDQETSRPVVPVRELHSDNGNGPLTVFYFANGFDSLPKPGAPSNVIHRDAGWKIFAGIERLLTQKHGFQKISDLNSLRQFLGNDLGRLNLLTPVQMSHDTQRRYFSTFVKREGGRTLIARSALFDTDAERNPRARSFPIYWKEAWENGDVIYFSGHSGDGAALSLNHILNSLTKSEYDAIQFPELKTQVVLLDSCSSYAHFQDLYMSRKPRRLQLVTFPLVSLFHLAPATIERLLELTVDPSAELPWADALRSIEQRQIFPHVEFAYQQRERAKALSGFQRRGQFPTGLLSVQVP